MNNYRNHAMEEFRAAGWVNDKGEYNDDMQEAICKHVLKLLAVFSKEGHSGSTAPYAIGLFSRLAKFEPIAPLTGEDWEWVKHDYGNGVSYQNKRASHVFKDEDGQAYDIEGKVFWEWAMPYDGREPFEPYKVYYTGFESRVPITFPYAVPDKPIYEYRHSDATPQQPAQNEQGFL